MLSQIAEILHLKVHDFDLWKALHKVFKLPKMQSFNHKTKIPFIWSPLDRDTSIDSTANQTQILRKLGPPKLAFTGKRHSGKTTAADYITSKYGYTEIIFAEPLKKVCRIMFGLTYAEVYDQKLKEAVLPRFGITPRDIILSVGYTIRETLPIYFDLDLNHASIFTEIAWNKILKVNTDTGIIISDLRYPDELNMCKQEDFLIVKIERAGLSEDAWSSDPSEAGVCSHMTIKNNGTIGDLYIQLDKLMQLS